MIAVIGALEIEIELLKSKLENGKSEKIAGMTFTVGTLFGKEVVLAVCGMGKVNAAACAQVAILRYAPEAVINVGVAGTLSRKLGIGDVAVGTNAVCHDLDTTALGDPPGFVSGLNTIRFQLSKKLAVSFCEACRKVGVRAVTGTIASGDQFISEPAKKAWISSTFGAIACEMEGQAIAQVCAMNETPCAILRSISDNADGNAAGEVADYESFKQMAANQCAKVLCAFLEG